MKKEIRKIMGYFIVIIAVTLFFITSHHKTSLSTATSFDSEDSIYYVIDKPLETDFPFEH